MRLTWIALALVVVGCVTGSVLHVHPIHHTSQCYQCAYSKADTVIEYTEVPRTVYDDVEVTRIELEDVTVTKVVTEQVEVPRVVEEAVQKPRVVHITEHVPQVVPAVVVHPEPLVSHKSIHPVEVHPVKSVHPVAVHPVKSIHPHPLPAVKTILVPVTTTKLEFDTVIVTKTVVDIVDVTKVVEEVIQVPKTVKDIIQVSRIVIDIHNTTHTTPGGWEKCLDAFTYQDALAHGIDIWPDCHDNCYTRLDGDNLYRGCYKGEFGVDPNLLGCSEQAGAIWCFCHGDLCNNAGKPGH